MRLRECECVKYRSVSEGALTIDTVTVEFETSVIEDKVDTSTLTICALTFQFFDDLPKPVHMITKDIFLCVAERVAAGRLERFDLFLSHVDEQRQIRRIAPKAD